MKLLSALAAATLVIAPTTAQAFEFTLDLRRVNVNTDRGQQQISDWVEEVVVNFCGPIDMPQPLEMLKVRTKCQQDGRTQALESVIQALDRRQDNVVWRPVLAKQTGIYGPVLATR